MVFTKVVWQRDSGPSVVALQRLYPVSVRRAKSARVQQAAEGQGDYARIPRGPLFVSTMYGMSG